MWGAVCAWVRALALYEEKERKVTSGNIFKSTNYFCLFVYFGVSLFRFNGLFVIVIYHYLNFKG